MRLSEISDIQQRDGAAATHQALPADPPAVFSGELAGAARHWFGGFMAGRLSSLHRAKRTGNGKEAGGDG